MSERAAVYLRIPGEPRGMARARHGRGFTYRDPAQEAYAQRVQAEWIAAGRPALTDGPYRVHMVAALSRPKAHYRRDGSLSAAGLRSPRPTRKPDADNILKQLDPLVAVGALPDDALVVDARVQKVWADPDDGPHLVVQATSLVTGLDGSEAA